MLDEIIKEQVVENICKNIGVSDEYFEDFVQEIYLILLEYDKDKLKYIIENNQINFFITRIIINQWQSSTSPFYKKYKKFYNIIDLNNNGYNVYDNIDDRFEDDD